MNIVMIKVFGYNYFAQLGGCHQIMNLLEEKMETDWNNCSSECVKDWQSPWKGDL